MTSSHTRDQARNGLIVVVCGVVGIALVAGLAMGVIWGFKAFNRSQRVADANNAVTTSRIKANNQVKLNEIQIGAQEQRVKIAQQQAAVRLENAKGVRNAQDEIAKTITPLYVQMEMVNALESIAKSGKNSTVIYLPVGPDGLPVVNTTDASKAAAGAR